VLLDDEPLLAWVPDAPPLAPAAAVLVSAPDDVVPVVDVTVDVVPVVDVAVDWELVCAAAAAWASEERVTVSVESAAVAFAEVLELVC
jgi:hypothetical protein